jgi:AcrR family transcriptional regulator
MPITLQCKEISVFAGGGDARRTLRLLWRHEQAGPGRDPGTPGPRPGLTVDQILRPAVRIADDQGLSAVSMRAVARSLDRTPAALYTYVSSRAELVDLMYDHVHGELPAPPAGPRPWAASLASWCAGLFELYARHPWLLAVSWARPVLGPGEQRGLESLLAVLDRGSVPAARQPAVVSACYSLAQGTARAAADQRAAARETGQADARWWQDRAAAMAEVVPDFARRFPRSAGLAAAQRQARPAAPWDDAPRRALAEAVRRIVTGLQAGGS